MKEYDMHLAALEISRETVAKLNDNGFKRDDFANLTYCHTGDYHGTYRAAAQLPNKDLWDRICSLLDADEGFSGYLEEELCEEEWREPLGGGGSSSSAYLPAMTMITCPVGRRKACDIHMAVFLDSTSDSAVEYMNRLKAPSVDRPGPEGIRRVYTITCESLADGQRLFRELYRHLSIVPGLYGRMKLEVTTRHYRKPADAMTLPLATKDAIASWLAECSSIGNVEDQFTEKRELVFA